MVDDAVLLRRYADERSQPAFEELVRRHLDLVYAAAMRRLGGDSHRAADVAQVVFATLARDAASLAYHAVLTGWLYTATRNAALNLLRTEERRRTREQEVYRMQDIFSPAEAEADWQQLRPVLDSAMDELAEHDRTAILLRYFEGRSLARVGAALGSSENAARMRVDRALEKLRERLAERGIVSTAAALGATLVAHPAISAPVGLAAAVVSASTAGWVATGVAAASQAAFIFMSTTKVIGGIVGLAAAIGFGVYLGAERTPAVNPEDAVLKQQVAALEKENERLKRDVAQLTAERPVPPATAVAPIPRPTVASSPPPVRTAAATPGPTTSDKSTSIMNNLRQIRGATRQFKLEYGRSPMSLDELVGETKFIWRLNAVAAESYQGLDLGNIDAALSVTMDDGTVVTMEAADVPTPPNPLVTAQEQAMARFRAGRGGQISRDSERAAYLQTDEFRQAKLLTTKGLAFQQEIGTAMAAEMAKAYRAFELANGRAPKVWEDLLAAGAFLDNPADRDRLFEVWHRVDAQFKP